MFIRKRESEFAKIWETPYNLIRNRDRKILNSMAKYTMDKIIDAGRKTFSKFGEDFTMSDVARELNTKASSLYRHVNTKRDLYFAMLTEEFKDFERVTTELVSQLENPTPEIILQTVGRYILKMSRENTERFLLMFMTKPPEHGGKLQEEPMGKFEEACDPQTIGFIHSLVIQHLQMHGLDSVKGTHITFYLISLVVGAGFVASPTYEYSSEDLFPISEYEELHEFVIDNSLKLWSKQEK